MPPEKFLSGGSLSADGRQQLTKLLRGYLNASVVDVFTLLPADLPDKKVIFLLTIDIISRYNTCSLNQPIGKHLDIFLIRKCSDYST